MREDRFFALFFSFYECWQVDFDYGHITHFCFSKETWLFQFQSGKLVINASGQYPSTYLYSMTSYKQIYTHSPNYIG